MDKIEDEIKNSRCPICGGSLKYIFHKGGGDSIIVPFSGEIKCTSCGMFSNKITRSDHESYHWKYDGSSEMKLKEEVWRGVKTYLKMVENNYIIDRE